MEVAYVAFADGDVHAVRFGQNEAAGAQPFDKRGEFGVADARRCVQHDRAGKARTDGRRKLRRAGRRIGGRGEDEVGKGGYVRQSQGMGPRGRVARSRCQRLLARGHRRPAARDHRRSARACKERRQIRGSCRMKC